MVFFVEFQPQLKARNFLSVKMCSHKCITMHYFLEFRRIIILIKMEIVFEVFNSCGRKICLDFIVICENMAICIFQAENGFAWKIGHV